MGPRILPSEAQSAPVKSNRVKTIYRVDLMDSLNAGHDGGIVNQNVRPVDGLSEKGGDVEGFITGRKKYVPFVLRQSCSGCGADLGYIERQEIGYRDELWGMQ